jgi:hypothetical protein
MREALNIRPRSGFSSFYLGGIGVRACDRKRSKPVLIFFLRMAMDNPRLAAKMAL